MRCPCFVADAQDLALFALALDAGLRKGELVALQWADVQQATLHVRRQRLQNGDTTLPKSRRARSLDISQETVSLLQAWKREQAQVCFPAANSLVFCQLPQGNHSGEPA